MSANDFVLRCAHDPGLADPRDSTTEVVCFDARDRPRLGRRPPSNYQTIRFRPAAHDRGELRIDHPFDLNLAARHMPARPQQWE
jgi:hypothetical protein